MKHPKVCVVVPCYNEEKTIGNCLSALKNQTYPNYEILVIDDASTDNTPKIVKENGIKLIRLEMNRGLARARNVGIQHADAEIIAFTDGDCVVEKRWLEELINVMKSKNLDVVIGKKVKPLNSYCYVVRAQLGGRSIKEIRDETLGGGYSAAYKREVFEELGGFNERFIRGCDFEFHLRVIESRFNLGWAKDAVVSFSYPDTVRKIWKQQSADGFWIKEVMRTYPWFIRRQMKFLAARVLIVFVPLLYVLWALRARKYDNLKMLLDHCVFVYLRSLAYCIGFLSPRPARYLEDDQ